MTKCAAIAETQGHSGPLLGTVITDAGSSRRRMDHQAHRPVRHEHCFERLCSHTRCSAVDGCVRRQGRPPRSVFSRANTMTRCTRSFCTVANGSKWPMRGRFCPLGPRSSNCRATNRRTASRTFRSTPAVYDPQQDHLLRAARDRTHRTVETSVRVGGATTGAVAIAEATETASQLLPAAIVV